MPARNPAPTLTILGAGKVGKSLGRLWHTRGIFTIQDVLSRSMDHARQAVSFIGAGRAVTAISELQPADVILVSTPDDRIAAWASPSRPRASASWRNSCANPRRWRLLAS